MTGPERSNKADALRRLRIVYASVFLFLISYIVLDGQPDNAATFGTLVGAAIVVLGLEVGFKVPGLTYRDKPKGEGE